MIFYRKSDECGCISLHDGNGGCAALWLETDAARLLGLSVPEQNALSGDLEQKKALIGAAEAECVRQGKGKLVFDFEGKQEGLRQLFEESGYTLEAQDPVISVKAAELLASAGVQKSMRMRFPDVEAWSFSDLLRFQIREIVEGMNRLGFPVQKEEVQGALEPSLCAVAYDGQYKICALLLASLGEGEVLVEFLYGSSAKSPQFILSVCQQFLKSLVKQKLVEAYPVIRMLMVNESVYPLIRRLLDKQYAITKEDVVLHAEKSMEAAGTPAEDGTVESLVSNAAETSSAAEDAACGAPEGPALTARQRNINEKYAWKFSGKFPGKSGNTGKR